MRDYDPGLPKVWARGGELNQVWTNLVDNALDAMGTTEGGGRLTVRTAREGDRVLVEVADDGPGVPEEMRTRIFEPYFTIKGVGEGTGLGLDIVRRIVVGQHKGDLRVESELGNTRFQVRLPLDAVGEGRGAERGGDEANGPPSADEATLGERAPRATDEKEDEG